MVCQAFLLSNLLTFIVLNLKPIIFILLAGCLFFSEKLYAQTDAVPKWDNQLFLGNKVAWGKYNWTYSGELQVRLKDNAQALDRWFLEAVVSYLPSKRWELVPDYRMSVKPEEVEHRPGMGVLYKKLYERSQLVHQFKWQADIVHNEEVEHGLRYILFYNYKFSDNFLGLLAGGGFYRWSEDFSGIQFFRAGTGVSWVMDVKHTINLNYFFGAQNFGDNEWAFQGQVFIQLVMRINKDYKYFPARYLNF